MQIFLIILTILVFLFGLCIGSFLNCVIYRLKTGNSLLGRSKCPSCHKTLKYKDLIPLLSFVLTLGKCRYCKKRISIQYPLVELASGLAFLLVFLYSLRLIVTNSLQIAIIQSLFLLFFTCVLIIIFVYDLKYSLVPDKIVLPSILIALMVEIVFSLLSKNSSLVLNYLLGGFIPFVFFFILVFFSGEKWMGWGDVKLGALIGLILGWPNVLVALILSFFSGALVGTILILFGKKKLRSQIPFGPFLCASTFLTFFVGDFLIKWYLGILGF